MDWKTFKKFLFMFYFIFESQRQSANRGEQRDGERI